MMEKFCVSIVVELQNSVPGIKLCRSVHTYKHTHILPKEGKEKKS